MTNEEYIRLHREEDVRSLALRKTPEGVDVVWCLQQIEGWQLARKKLPRWAGTEGLWFPPRLSMEQCSSEATAGYKRGIVERLCDAAFSLTDLTGGFGVDFSYMARGAERCVYVERQEVLCEAASHNFPLLGIGNAEIVNADAEEFVNAFCGPHSAFHIVYADPARRDNAGRKTVAIEDCTPDICTLQDRILSAADYMIVKMSPMLDIGKALSVLRNVAEIHVVSVRGECKELLFVLRACSSGTACLTYHCANLAAPDAPFVCTAEDSRQSKGALQYAFPAEGMVLVEPNASILKAGVQDAFALRHGLAKLHPMSNLYVCEDGCTYNNGVKGKEEGAPGIDKEQIGGRAFRIVSVCDFSKNSLRQLRNEVRQANIAIRNFPSTVAELRKQLKLKEGGTLYLFATTLKDGSHALLRCEKL